MFSSVQFSRSVVSDSLRPHELQHAGHGTTDWFQIGKGVHQGSILLPCLFNLYADEKRWAV